MIFPPHLWCLRFQLVLQKLQQLPHPHGAKGKRGGVNVENSRNLGSLAQGFLTWFQQFEPSKSSLSTHDHIRCVIWHQGIPRLQSHVCCQMNTTTSKTGTGDFFVPFHWQVEFGPDSSGGGSLSHSKLQKVKLCFAISSLSSNVVNKIFSERSMIDEFVCAGFKYESFDWQLTLLSWCSTPGGGF